jgi:hypothetical protein
MAKRANWYPTEHLYKASNFILDKISGYKTRMTYGGSMGGYAAVKFSSLLGATDVIALCPQWSIDSEECQGVDPGWGDFFVSKMRGMGIRTQDISGNVFLFFDAFNTRDMFHCRMIKDKYPEAYFINVPMVGHHVTTVFAGTENLLELINACRVCDITALREFSRRTRKSHPIWKREIVLQAMRKFPRLGIQLLINADHRDLLPVKRRHLPRILSYLASTVGSGRAVTFYEDFRPLLPDPVEQHMICAYLVGVIGGRAAIATTHGSGLIYDLSENRVLHKGAPLDPWEIPIEAELLHFAVTLFVTIGGTKFHLSVNDKRGLNVPAIKERREESSLFEIKPSGNGQFAIGYGGQYMSADPRGTVICNRDTAKDWEMFRFGPFG